MTGVGGADGSGMDYDTSAETGRIDAGRSPKDHVSEAGVHVLVVRLEEADRQMMIEPGCFKVHSPACRYVRTPGVGLVVRSAYHCAAPQSVNEWSNRSMRKRKITPPATVTKPSSLPSVPMLVPVTGAPNSCSAASI